MKRKTKAPATYRDGVLDLMLAAACIAGGVLGLKVVSDSAFWNPITRAVDPAAVVGKLSRAEGGVRYRFSESPMWHDLVGQEKQSVSDGDYVFTGSNGTANLELTTGATAKIAHDSMIRLRRQKSDTYGSSWLGNVISGIVHPHGEISSAGIEKGSIHFDLKGDKTLRIEVKGRVFEVNANTPGGAFEAELSDDPIEPLRFKNASKIPLQIQEAKAGGAKGEKMTLADGQDLLIGDGSEVGSRNILTGKFIPESGAKIWTSGRKAVGFSWDSGALTAGNVMIELKDKDSKPLLALKGADGHSGRAVLSPGRYQWRVVQKDSQGKISETRWQSFELKELLHPPTLLGPVDDLKFSTEPGKKKRVALTWVPLPDGAQAEVELTPASAKSKRKTFLESGENVGEELSADQYSWRARLIDADGDKSDWTPLHHFWVQAGEADNSKTVSAFVPASPAQAKREQEAAYSTTLYANQGTSGQTRTENSREEASVAGNPAHTKRDGRKRTMSRLAKLVPRHVVLYGQGENGKAGEDLGAIRIKFYWNPVPQIQEYQVSVFDKSGAKIKEAIVKQSQYLMTLNSLEHTHYSFQVAARFDSLVVLTSDRSKVVVEFPVPVPGSPGKGSVHSIGRTIVLAWKRTPLTQKYKLQVSQDPKFKTVVLDETLVSNNKMFRPKGLGEFYWRIRGSSGSSESAWSDVSSFRVK